MNRKLAFITCTSDPAVLNRYLLSSPCLVVPGYHQTIYHHADSAASAFNYEISEQRQAVWLVWAHQDVFLPQGWDSGFITAIAEAERCFSKLAVVGVYGVSGAGRQAKRAGHLLDRGKLLRESTRLPCLVDTVDELLFAVRTDSGLQLDSSLGFDFYGADLALSAMVQGFDVAVVDAYCEHWSETPQQGAMAKAEHQGMLSRIIKSGRLFEQKWADHLPLETPCFSISAPGDVERQCLLFAGKGP